MYGHCKDALHSQALMSCTVDRHIQMCCALVPAKDEELEFSEIPCHGEAEAEVPTADNDTSSGADLDPVVLQRQPCILSLRQRCSQFFLPHNHKPLYGSKK